MGRTLMGLFCSQDPGKRWNLSLDKGGVLGKPGRSEAAGLWSGQKARIKVTVRWSEEGHPRDWSAAGATDSAVAHSVICSDW